MDRIKLVDWQRLSTQLKTIKAKEMELRREICAEILKGMEIPCKKKDLELGVVAENSVSHNLDDASVNAMWKEFSIEEKEAIKFEPKLKLREYKKLPKGALIHDAVIIKPSAPTLKIL